jgi:hypothetical protein
MDKEEAKNLLADFLNARKDERKEEQIGLARRLKVCVGVWVRACVRVYLSP